MARCVLSGAAGLVGRGASSLRDTVRQAPLPLPIAAALSAALSLVAYVAGHSPTG